MLDQILKVETKTLQIVYVSGLGLANSIPIHLDRSYHRPPKCSYQTPHAHYAHHHYTWLCSSAAPNLYPLHMQHDASVLRHPSPFVAWAIVISCHSIQIHCQSLGTTITYFEDGPNICHSPYLAHEQVNELVSHIIKFQ